MSTALVILTASEAQRLTQRIKLVASGVRDNLFKLRNLVDEAQRSNAWQVLGFKSWTAYLADTLGSEPMRLKRDERQELVAYLSGEGMSTRAIAPIVGVSREQVRKDVAGDTKLSPADAVPVVDVLTGEVVSGDVAVGDVDASGQQDGHEYAVVAGGDGMADGRVPVVEGRKQFGQASVVEAGDLHVRGSVGEVAVGDVPPEHFVVDADVHPDSVRVTGMDGKTYPRPESHGPRRRSLVDAAFTANTALYRVVETIRGIHADDRFARNKADVLDALRPSADLAIETLTGLFNIKENN